MSESENELKADTNFMSKKVKSELWHIWKKARLMYDMVGEDSELEDWVKKSVRSAHDSLDEAMRYTEYEKIFPNKDESPEEDNKNNFLSNEDKRYPTPVDSESGDQFVTRCILDANMKKRYPVQGDRFSACMLIFNDKKQSDTPPSHNNPGEKFEDPMKPKEEGVSDPIKPILP